MLEREAPGLGCNLFRYFCSFRYPLGSSESIVAKAEDVKMSKYTNLKSSYLFVPVAVKTCGVISPKTMTYITELGHHLKSYTEDQCISVPATEYISSRSAGE